MPGRCTLVCGDFWQCLIFVAVTQKVRGGSLCLPTKPVVDKCNGSKEADIQTELFA